MLYFRYISTSVASPPQKFACCAKRSTQKIELPQTWLLVALGKLNYTFISCVF